MAKHVWVVEGNGRVCGVYTTKDVAMASIKASHHVHRRPYGSTLGLVELRVKRWVVQDVPVMRARPGRPKDTVRLRRLCRWIELRWRKRPWDEQHVLLARKRVFQARMRELGCKRTP